MGPFWRAIPLSWFHPLRRLAATRPRGAIARHIAVLILRQAARAFRGRLSQRLDEVRPLDRPDLRFTPIDSMVMEAIHWFGVRGYEGEVASVWTRACAHASAVLEIGGNVGLFTVIGARVCPGCYTVVEPMPAVVAALERNLTLNGLGRVTVLPAAAIPGSSAGDVTLTIPDDHRQAPVGAAISDHAEGVSDPAARQITVPGLPFATLIQGKDLIKIDAEGIEAALLGAVLPRLLATRPTLLIEVLPDSHRLAELLGNLAIQARYRIEAIPEWGDPTLVTIQAQDFTAEVPGRHRSKDVLLTPLP
jgi:FkbM family methyltransferase